MTTTAERDAEAPVPSARAPARGRGRFLMVCALLAAAVALLLYKGLLSSLDYFDTVDQALAHRAQIGTSVIRLEGLVVSGTVRPTAVGTSFAMSGQDGRRVEVADVGTTPLLFQAGIPVVVVGRFASSTSTSFDATQIMVKHSATYIAAHPARVRAPNGSVR